MKSFERSFLRGGELKDVTDPVSLRISSEPQRSARSFVYSGILLSVGSAAPGPRTELCHTVPASFKLSYKAI